MKIIKTYEEFINESENHFLNAAEFITVVKEELDEAGIKYHDFSSPIQRKRGNISIYFNPTEFLRKEVKRFDIESNINPKYLDSFKNTLDTLYTDNFDDEPETYDKQMIYFREGQPALKFSGAQQDAYSFVPVRSGIVNMVQYLKKYYFKQFLERVAVFVKIDINKIKKEYRGYELTDNIKKRIKLLLI